MLGLLAAGGAAGLLPGWFGGRAIAAIKTNAHIVILGAGAAGLTAANRLRRLADGARITLIDAKTEHHYQPGYTLVATGVWAPRKVIDRNERFVPEGVEWLREMVAEIDPAKKTVTTAAGTKVNYDFLIVATGLHLNYAGIEGMSPDLIGKNGIGSVYGNPAATWAALSAFREKGGNAVMTLAGTPIKCAGAPLKLTFLTHARLVEAGTREKSRITFHAPGTAVFSIPEVAARVVDEWKERSIDIAYKSGLKAVDASARKAVFTTPDGDKTVEYDFLHVVPPMRAPDAVLNSPLGWQEGPLKAGGWIEVDKFTLRHLRFPEVFGAGDINGVPFGKTAASVKNQTPIAVANLLATIEGKEPYAKYDGYTSCPLITEIGKALLIEFNYDKKLIPSFPIDPMREHWVWWVMKTEMLHSAYNAMLRGEIGLPATAI